uniref:Zn(2)-C6 fungal-type domain-containing protein n=1 Tax=Mycena chlorophos TaxID=658473 RepID=A0ABQ0LZH3_MYCCL|nr:predicted protein [Mycena chlorophos]
MPHPSQQQSDDDRRTRSYIACLNCRKRKTKCITDAGATRPCMHCVQRGLRCVYEAIDHAPDSGSPTSAEYGAFAPQAVAGGSAQGSTSHSPYGGMPVPYPVQQQPQQQQQYDVYGNMQGYAPDAAASQYYSGYAGGQGQGYEQAYYGDAMQAQAQGYPNYMSVLEPANALQDDVRTEGDIEPGLEEETHAEADQGVRVQPVLIHEGAAQQENWMTGSSMAETGEEIASKDSDGLEAHVQSALERID